MAEKDEEINRQRSILEKVQLENHVLKETIQSNVRHIGRLMSLRSSQEEEVEGDDEVS